MQRSLDVLENLPVTHENLKKHIIVLYIIAVTYLSRVHQVLQSDDAFAFALVVAE